MTYPAFSESRHPLTPTVTPTASSALPSWVPFAAIENGTTSAYPFNVAEF